MVADFVNQHMADDMAQRLLMFGPVIEDRPAVEPDHVGQAGNVVIAAERQAEALEKAEQVEFALSLHFVEDLVGRKIVDADDHALAQGSKALWQALENLMRHGFHFRERGCLGFFPHRACLARVPPARLLVLDAIARLTLARQSETVRPDNRLWVDAMKRIVTAVIVTAFAGFLLPNGGAQAQTAPSGLRAAQPSEPAVTD